VTVPRVFRIVENTDGSNDADSDNGDPNITQPYLMDDIENVGLDFIESEALPWIHRNKGVLGLP
jgi:hypothetical protein